MAGEKAVNEEALKKQIASMDKKSLEETLLKIRTRQKTQQLKQSGKGQKEYQKKQREKLKLMKENALKQPATKPGFGNLWEQIEADAKAAAEAKVTSTEAPAGQTAPKA